MNVYQPRFVAYCRSIGKAPELVSGPAAMAAFITWVRRAWASWAAETKHVGPKSDADHAAFDAWLGVYAAPLVRGPEPLPILTDEAGRIIPRPAREDFETLGAFLQAHHEFNTKVASIANAAFDDQFRRAMKEP